MGSADPNRQGDIDGCVEAVRYPEERREFQLHSVVCFSANVVLLHLEAASACTASARLLLVEMASSPERKATSYVESTQTN